jgi:hypothetical protein
MAGVEQIFPWDFQKPKTAFWDDIEWNAGRCFFHAFPNRQLAESSLEAKIEGGLVLPSHDKLQILLDILQQRLEGEEARAAASVPPTTFRDANYNTWMSLLHGIHVLQGFADAQEEKEKIMLMLMEAQAPDGSKNLSEHHGMCFQLVEKGEYAEAEAMGLEVLDWLQSHRLCGPSSPQALSIRRLLVRTAWKTGAKDKAQERIGELRVLVDGLPQGKFAKYTDEERDMLNELVAELNA